MGSFFIFYYVFMCIYTYIHIHIFYYIYIVKHLGQIPHGAILVTADVVGFYPGIPHKAGLEALRRRFNKRETFEIPTEDIVQMAEFVLKNNFFEFNGEVKRQNQVQQLGVNLHLLTLVFS